MVKDVKDSPVIGKNEGVGRVSSKLEVGRDS